MDFRDDEQEATSVGHQALDFEQLSDPGRTTQPAMLQSRQGARPSLPGAALVQIYGHDLGRRYEVKDGALRVGRGMNAEVLVRDGTASRLHCEVVREDGVYRLRDLGSTNHTYLNDERVEAAELRNGDVIRVGAHMFKFLSGENHEAAYYDEVHRVMQTDSLTGALNRRGFEAELERLWYSARRYEHVFSILMIDIDHFKRVNDRYGHRFGDLVLSRLGKLCLDGKRFSDAFCRYGGEEFAFLLADTGAEGASLLAERLRHRIRGARFENDEGHTPITVSIGYATYREGVESKEALIELADAALYEAKRRGRDRVCAAPPGEEAPSTP